MENKQYLRGDTIDMATHNLRDDVPFILGDVSDIKASEKDLDRLWASVRLSEGHRNTNKKSGYILNSYDYDTVVIVVRVSVVAALIAAVIRFFA